MGGSGPNMPTDPRQTLMSEAIGRQMYGATPAGAVTGRAPRDDVLRGEMGWLPRPDGRVSTELSITERDPRLMGGQFVNVPLLVKGQTGVADLLADRDPTNQQRDLAISRAIQRVTQGGMLPSYPSLETALQAAEGRPVSQKNPYPRGTR